jgi:hypothetical protein
MNNTEFKRLQEQLGLNTEQLTKLLGYEREITIYEFKSGARPVPRLVENFAIALLAMGEKKRKQVVIKILNP